MIEEASIDSTMLYGPFNPIHHEGMPTIQIQIQILFLHFFEKDKETNTNAASEEGKEVNIVTVSVYSAKASDEEFSNNSTSDDERDKKLNAKVEECPARKKWGKQGKVK